MARYKKGDWKVVCDLSGAVVNASDCKMQWNGLFVHKRFWRPKPPGETPIIHPVPKVPKVLRPEGEIETISAVSVTAADL